MPDYAVPPGDTLREVMGSLDMSQAELARRTELTVQTLNRILKGEQPITYETAGRLELVTGVPASLWNNLEAQYREQLARISERERLASKGEWLMGWPIWLMGWPIGWAGVEPLDRERFRSWKRSHGLY